MASEAVDHLRHMTSNSGLARASNRLSQHLRTSDPRLGSRSPSSIPSSPTSVHSSSSAIFERDIEPIISPSPPHSHQPHHPPNPHRIPRSKGTEQLEQSVPSVLDSAAAILASLEEGESGDQVAVLAPATSIAFDSIGRTSGFASPIGSFRSRSPSPLGSRPPPNLLLSIPALPTTSVSPPTATSPTASLTQPRPTVQTNRSATPPAIVTPTSAYFSTTSSTAASDSSPTTTTAEHPLHPLPNVSSSPPHQQHAAVHSSPSTATTSHPPSPNALAINKRLSFMSYSDLLTSTPASTLPLSSLTTAASSTEPPPHIPSVSGYTQASAHAHGPSAGSAAASLRGFSMGTVSSPIEGGASIAGVGGGAILAAPGKRDSIVMVDDVGGEWEREGMGRGLEERLEALMPIQVPGKA